MLKTPFFEAPFIHSSVQAVHTVKYVTSERGIVSVFVVVEIAKILISHESAIAR